MGKRRLRGSNERAAHCTKRDAMGPREELQRNEDRGRDAKTRTRRAGLDEPEEEDEAGGGGARCEHQTGTELFGVFHCRCVKELSLMWFVMAPRARAPPAPSHTSVPSYHAPPAEAPRRQSVSSNLAARGIRAGRRVAPSAVCVSCLVVRRHHHLQHRRRRRFFVTSLRRVGRLLAPRRVVLLGCRHGSGDMR